MSCSVLFSLTDAATAADVLLCSTSPESPLLFTRVGVLVLLAPFCSDVASDFAFCSFQASWPAI